jgi:hypothetical protein
MENPINDLNIINRKTKEPLENISDFSLRERKLYFCDEERHWATSQRNFEESYFPFFDLFAVKNNGDIHEVQALAHNGIAIRYGSMPIFHKDLSDFERLLLVDHYERYPFGSDFLNMGAIEVLFKDHISSLKMKRGMNHIKRIFKAIYGDRWQEYTTDKINRLAHIPSVVRMIDYYRRLEMPKSTRTSVLRLLNSFEHELLTFEMRRSMDKMVGATRALKIETDV